MSTKTILLAVTDRETVVDITQALGHRWDVTSVLDEAEALALLEQRSFDAMLVDFNLGSPDASQLLNQALKSRPEIVRFLLAYEADLALVAAYVLGPHEILSKPVELGSLKSRIEHGVSPDDSNAADGNTDADVAAAPVVPSIYSEVLNALDSPSVTTSQVGQTIAKDAALTSDVLRFSNSTYSGLPRIVTDLSEAVETMGLSAVRALVMTRRFLAEQSHLRLGYLSLEKIWAHGTSVAQLSRDLILFETKDRELASDAFAAGLIHDLGKVVLASNFDDLYGRVYSLARKQPVALSDVEKEMFGASHGEIGACLAGMWNMPSAVVQAVALHHEPPLGEVNHLTPLAAVHVANVLQHQIQPSDEFRVAPVVSTPFLNQLGLLQRLPVWRAVFANRQAARAGGEVEPVEASQSQIFTPSLASAGSPTANHLPSPKGDTQTGTLGQPGSEQATPSAPVSLRWVYAGTAAVCLGAVALWLGSQPRLTVHARIPEPTADFAQVPALPSSKSEPVITDMSEDKTPSAGFHEAPPLSVVTAPDSSPEPQESESTMAIASLPTATNAPAPLLATEAKAQPDFRLSGIIYTVSEPVAIVNGQSVCVGGQVRGATVIAINRNSVKLWLNGHEFQLSLRGTD